jgi:hypothetical protein
VTDQQLHPLLSGTSFISKSNLTAFKQFPTVAVVISPFSALEFCLEIKDIICFSQEKADSINYDISILLKPF